MRTLTGFVSGFVLFVNSSFVMAQETQRLAQAITPHLDEQMAAIVKDQSGLIRVTRQQGNILEFELTVRV